jgi:replicative DNA helicase
MTTDSSKYSSQYERGLLGLIYTNKDLLLQTKQRLTSQYFLYKPHRIIYTAMCLLSDQVELSTVDVDTLYTESSKLGLQESGVDSGYLMTVCQSNYSASNYDFYFSKILEAYKKYQLHETLADLQTLVDRNYSDLEGSLSSKELYDEVGTGLSRLDAFEEQEKEAIVMNERAEEYLIERAEETTTVRGLTTGFNRLDETLNGLTDGSLTVIAGPAGAGKSTVLLNIANHVAFDCYSPKPVLFLSTEMYTDEDLSRLIAMRSMIQERHIANGTAYHDPKQRRILQAVLKEIQSGQLIFHEYMPEFNASKLASKMTYYKHKYDIGLVVFDYIKLETSLDTNQLKNRREDQILGDIANILKLTAGKLKIPAVAGCQINTRTKRIADSDRIIRYCNNLIELCPKTVEQMKKEGDTHKYGTHEFIIRKARAGGGRTSPIRFWKPCNLIQECEIFQEEVSEEEAKEESNIFALTTPREYKKKVNDYFKVERLDQQVERVEQIAHIVDQVTPQEMEITEGQVDPRYEFTDDDMTF